MRPWFLAGSTVWLWSFQAPQLKRDSLDCTDHHGITMIRKLASGKYRLYSLKKNPKTGRRRNLGTFPTRAAAEKHEREVGFFKRRGPRGAA